VCVCVCVISKIAHTASERIDNLSMVVGGGGVGQHTAVAR